MGKYGFIFVGEHLLSCRRGLVSRKLKTPFVLPDERQKDLCWADWTSSRFSWILWCSDSTPSSPESSIHLDIHRAWQNFAAIMIDLDIRNSKFSRAILVSLELSIVLILTKYVRAVTLFICRWTVFNSFKFVKVISVIFSAFIPGNCLIPVFFPPCHAVFLSQDLDSALPKLPMLQQLIMFWNLEHKLRLAFPCSWKLFSHHFSSPQHPCVRCTWFFICCIRSDR